MRPTTTRVLAALRRAGRKGCTTHDLCQPAVGGLSFGTRIAELRAAGHVIDRIIERKESHRYYLVSSPADVVHTPSGAERAEQEPTALFETHAETINAALNDPDLAA